MSRICVPTEEYLRVHRDKNDAWREHHNALYTIGLMIKWCAPTELMRDRLSALELRSLIAACWLHFEIQCAVDKGWAEEYLLLAEALFERYQERMRRVVGRRAQP